MAKTIPISDELYDLLAKLKRPEEDFTDVIFRLLGSRAKKEGFLAWLELEEPNEDLASSIEAVYQARHT
ncbi:MAG: hypothetical protein GF308_03100 [Candidatus Heimdallarchaeota archaeon]|nr:hypothetical protein [Candidatus Heimdallarchaeota archaeon]